MYIYNVDISNCFTTKCKMYCLFVFHLSKAYKGLVHILMFHLFFIEHCKGYPNRRCQNLWMHNNLYLKVNDKKSEFEILLC